MSEKKSKKSKKEEKQEDVKEEDNKKNIDYNKELKTLEIIDDVKELFETIKSNIKAFEFKQNKDKNKNKQYQNERLYQKVKRIYVLLSNNSRKFFDRKIKRFSEQNITSKDDLSTLTEIINEMIDKFIDEYPKFISKSVENELNQRIEGRDECIEKGEEIAKRFNMDVRK